MHHQTSSPVPGIAVFSGISRRIKIVLVDFSCRIPAVNVSVNAITSRLCRIKSTRVERINFRRLPRSIRTSALPVHRLIAVRIRRKDEIIPVSHPEKVRALKRTLCIHRSIERLAIVPVMQILRFAQTHTASPRRFSFFLRRKNHPPAVFLLTPENKRIPPVDRLIDHIIRCEAVLRDFRPHIQIGADGMIHVVLLRQLLKGTVKHVIQAIHFDHRTRAAHNFCIMLRIMNMICRAQHHPAVLMLFIPVRTVIAKIKRFKNTIVIIGDHITQHCLFRSKIKTHPLTLPSLSIEYFQSAPFRQIQQDQTSGRASHTRAH